MLLRKNHLPAWSPTAIFSLLVLLPVTGRGAGTVNTSITSEAIYSSEKVFLPGQEGLKLKEGLNLLEFERAGVEISSRTAGYLELKQNLADKFARAEIFKLYFSAKVAGLAVVAGKDSYNIGPAENGLLLSKNAAPFPMLRITNATPLRLWGDWHFLVLNGWLTDSNSSAKAPELLAVRAEYSPWTPLTLGLTRMSYYSGPGRPTYKLWEYPKLLIGANENIPYSRYDTDGYLGYDVSLDLPQKFLPGNVKKAGLYYEDAGTDINAFWQNNHKGERYHFPFGIKLQLNSYTGGLAVETDRDKFRLEFQTVNPLFYVNKLYPAENYQGLSFGSPYGRNLKQFFFSQERKTGEKSGFKYELGYVKQPAFDTKYEVIPLASERYYASFAVSKGWGNASISPFTRLDLTKNRNPSIATVPLGQFNITKGNRAAVILGLSATFGF